MNNMNDAEMDSSGILKDIEANFKAVGGNYIEANKYMLHDLIARREAAAYERGRIAEAKTCAEAGRHDVKKAEERGRDNLAHEIDDLIGEWSDSPKIALGYIAGLIGGTRYERERKDGQK